MRVIQVPGRFAPTHCGVAHYTARLASELARQGAEVAIASYPTGAAAPTDLLPLSSPVWSVNTLQELLALSRRRGADWLHLQFAPASFSHRRIVGLLPLLARLGPGAPRLAVTVHEYGGWSLQPPVPVALFGEPVLRLAERAGWIDRELLFLLSLADQVIATNPDHLVTIRQRSKVLAQRLAVVPIGANVGPELVSEITPAQARAMLGVPVDQLVVVFFGFVHPVKGIETLLQAVQVVRARQPNVQLWIVGGVHSLALQGAEADRYEARLRQLIDQLGLANAVCMTGYLADRDAALRLRAADVAALPFNRGVTLKSGSLITCLGFGLPVIATAGGQLTELRHRDNVWLVPPRDPAQLASAIEALIGDCQLRAHLGSEGARVARQFSWSAIAQRHLDLYDRPAPRRLEQGTT